MYERCMGVAKVSCNSRSCTIGHHNHTSWGYYQLKFTSTCTCKCLVSKLASCKLYIHVHVRTITIADQKLKKKDLMSLVIKDTVYM